MSVKSFENNGTNTSENIVKMKLAQNIKSLLYNPLVHIHVQWKQIFDNFGISLADKTENSLSHSSQFRVIIESV